MRSGGDTVEELAPTDQLAEPSPTRQAIARTLGWCFGVGAAAGAAGGFAFIVQDDEIAGAAVLAAVVGGLLGLLLAAVPAAIAATVVGLAARRSETASDYQWWVLGTVGSLALLIPVVAFRFYVSFTVDPADDVGLRSDTQFAVGVGVAFLVAETLLIPMWRGLRTLRD